MNVLYQTGGNMNINTGRIQKKKKYWWKGVQERVRSRD